MHKTRLGISVGLLGSGLFFFGAVSIIPAFLLAAYVLFFEENDWLKKSAIKMLTVVITFGILGIGVDLIQDVLGILNSLFSWLPFTIKAPFHLDNILNYIISFIRDVLLVLMGFKALSMGTMRISFVDRIIEKHM